MAKSTKLKSLLTYNLLYALTLRSHLDDVVIDPKSAKRRSVVKKRKRKDPVVTAISAERSLNVSRLHLRRLCPRLCSLVVV